MMKRHWILTIAIACAAAVASYAASRAVYSRQTAAEFGAGMAPIVEYLGLDQKQRERVESVDATFRKHQETTCAEMQNARAKLLDVLRKPRPSRVELNSALAEVARAQAGMQRHAAKYILDIKPFLSDVQKDKLFGLVGQKFCGQGRFGARFCPTEKGTGRHGRGWAR
jgi:hypothetical protein